MNPPQANGRETPPSSPHTSATVTGFGASAYGQAPPTYLIWARIAAAGGVLFNVILGSFLQRADDFGDSGDLG